MPSSMSSDLRQFIARFLDPPETDWWERDLTSSYKWLKSGELYWIIDAKTDNSLMVLKRAEGSYACLNCPTGLAVIANVLATDLGVVPSEKLNVAQFAELLMEWYRDPRGYIATPQFFEKKQSTLEGWLQGKEKDPHALRAVCVDPVYSTQDNGTWSLIFHVINRLGGVEEWTVQGQMVWFQIQTIAIKTLRDNGTFSYPDEL